MDKTATPPTLRFPQAFGDETPSATDAFRIQVAAVAAQQLALLEEECRLQDQQDSLARQRQQLAALLEEKHTQAAEAAKQLQAARRTLNRDRKQHSLAAAKQVEELAAGQSQLEASHKDLQAKRRRILLLERKLKFRANRQAAVQIHQIRRREAAVEDQHRRIEREAEKLQKEREALTRARLTFRGEQEQANRHLQAERRLLAQEQNRNQQQRDHQESELADRVQMAQQREDALTAAEKALAAQVQSWEQNRRIAEAEARGLEDRIAHLRQKLQGLQSQLGRLEKPPAETDNGRCSGEAVPVGASPGPLNSLTLSLFAATSPFAIGDPNPFEIQRTSDLVAISEDLADQRLQLVEHWQRMVEVQSGWECAKQTALEELEKLIKEIARQESTLQAKDESLASRAAEIQARDKDLSGLRQHLEGWAASLRIQETKWNSDQERLMAGARHQKLEAEKQLVALAEVRHSWTKLRQQESDSLRAMFANCAKLQKQNGDMQLELWKHALSLEQKERELAEKTLALEEYRQQFIVRAADAATAESRLDRLRRKWERHTEMSFRTIAEEFARLQAEGSQLQKRGQTLLMAAEELANREAKLAQQQADLEQQRITATVSEKQLDLKWRDYQSRHEDQQLQIGELQNEVERLAGLLMAECDTPSQPPADAA